MGQEIERKFLLQSDAWRAEIRHSTQLEQGYLADTQQVSVRVRLLEAEDRAWLNIKSATLGISRAEYEYEIPAQDARTLLDTLCGAKLEKTRHWVEHAGHTWEIDEFAGANAGLVVAELELTAVEAPFERPPWLGREVSNDPRYYNNQLAQRPYQTWEQD